METIFTKKEIKLLRLLVGSGLIRFNELRRFNKLKLTKHSMCEFEDVCRHFMLETMEVEKQYDCQSGELVEKARELVR